MNKSIFLKAAKVYLQSNAMGMEDGSLKATNHKIMCDLFICARLEIDKKKADRLFIGDESIGSLVRKSTLPLTDNLDVEIGFPLDRAPNYNRLTPIFISKFINLASCWFDDRPELMSDILLSTNLDLITKRAFRYAMQALTSYGFEFCEGEGEGENRFLTMESKLGQIVTVKPNLYLGCNYTIDVGLGI